MNDSKIVSKSLAEGARVFFVEPERIDVVDGVVAHVHVEVDLSRLVPKRILADKPLQAGMVVPRPVVIDAREAVVFPPGELEWIRKPGVRRRCGAERLTGAHSIEGPVQNTYGATFDPESIGCAWSVTVRNVAISRLSLRRVQRVRIRPAMPTAMANIIHSTSSHPPR